MDPLNSPAPSRSHRIPFINHRLFSAGSIALRLVGITILAMLRPSLCVSGQSAQPSGSAANSAGESRNHASVAVDGAGNVYVTDSTTAAVYQVAPNGMQTRIGKGIIAPGDVAVDSEGNVYVLDTAVPALYKITSAGAQTRLGRGFIKPSGIAVDSEGNVFVIDPGVPAVYKVTQAGKQTIVKGGFGKLPDASGTQANNAVLKTEGPEQLGVSTNPALPPGFRLVQKCHSISNTTNTCTFAKDVTPGDLVIGGAVIDNMTTSSGVSDGAGNAFTISASSPCTGGSVPSHAWVFYLLSSPGGPNTKTVVFSDTSRDYVNDIWAYEFSVSGGTAAFDTDANGCGSSTTSNNPTAKLALSGPNDLAYFVSYLAGGGAFAVGPPWTDGTLTQLHNVDGYSMTTSSSIRTAIAPSGQGWGIVMAMAIKLVPAL